MKNRARFNDQEDYYHIIDIIARSYGTLPSEIKKLSWEDLIFKTLGFREEDVYWMCGKATRIESITEPITWSIND